MKIFSTLNLGWGEETDTKFCQSIIKFLVEGSGNGHLSATFHATSL